MSLEITLIVDVLLMLQALWIVLQVSDRSIFNPSLWYIALHVYCVTFRLIALNFGFQSAAFTGIRSDAEIVKAAIACDISLLAVVAATIWVVHRTEKKAHFLLAAQSPAKLSYQIGSIIAFLCVTVGGGALLRFGLSPIAATQGANVTSSEASADLSSIPRILGSFAVQGPLILCAMRGFTLWPSALLLILIAGSSLGLARTFFVLPILLAVLIYHAQRERHTLSPRWLVALAFLGVVWFAFKPFARGLQAGESVSRAMGDAGVFLQDSLNVGSGDTQFLDMQATYMAAADETGRRFYGATVLPVIYLPIPRIFWPDKPRLNEYATELASGSRSMVQEGLTPNLSGESYLDFGFLGCAVIPFLYLMGMQSMYQRVKYQDISSPKRWLYLVFLVCMVQVFRDGLMALFLFPFLNFLPLTIWGLISLWRSRERKTVATFRGARWNPSFSSSKT